MSSDGHVSDHGRQIVEPIENIRHVQMRRSDSSEDERASWGREGAASPRAEPRGRRAASDELGERDDVRMEEPESSESEATQRPRGGTVSSGSSAGRRTGTAAESNGSTDGEDAGEDATDSASDVAPRDGSLQSDAARTEDDGVLSKEQPPPSGQDPSGGSDYSPGDADSTASTAASQASADDSMAKGTSRKRKSPPEGLDSAISIGGASDFRPMKKAKGSLNRAYLDLLNEDIQHAASQYVPQAHDQLDERVALPASQIGMTVWTVLEKERFFEALGRLGRDDAAGIARRVRTKGEMEVRQYMKLLQDGLANRRRQNELDPIELADFPAALELSHECCVALEEAGDCIAMRQGHSEDANEERRRGPGWLITQEKSKDLIEDATEGDVSQAASVFRVPEWLTLSERFFMNAPVEEGNWQAVDGDTPSIRTTALDDFQTLVVTLTKRLVAASLYVATSRIRAERGYRPDIKDIVKNKDVQAAALSLGLAVQKPPLTACVRRLGLSVYEHPPKPNEDGEEEPIPHDDVEDAMGTRGQRGVGQIRWQMERVALSSDDTSESSHSAMESDSEEERERVKEDVMDPADSQEDHEIQAEADEAILYSAVDPPQTKRDRQALLRRIGAERAAERYADAVDTRASYQEEVRMWEVLGRQPTEDLIDPGSPPSGRRLKISVDASYSVGKDWRAKTKVMSEWEAGYRGV